MAVLPNNVRIAIAKIIKQHGKLAVTTTNAVVTECQMKLSNLLSPAMVHMAQRKIYEEEVRRQFKTPLPANVRAAVASNFPVEMKDYIEKLPAWFAIEKGAGARHVLTINATAEHWAMAARMKQKHANETRVQARNSRNIGDVLVQLGVNCIGDLIGESKAA